jgi:hypothetical protein
MQNLRQICDGVNGHADTAVFARRSSNASMSSSDIRQRLRWARGLATLTAGMIPAPHHSITVVRLTPNRRATLSGVNLRSINDPPVRGDCGQVNHSDLGGTQVPLAGTHGGIVTNNSGWFSFD